MINEDKKRVVIVGGGFAGSHIAKKLQNEFDLTLIDNKSYFEFTPGILRTLVEPEHIKKVQVLHSHYLPKAEFILGHASKFTKTYVVVKKKKVRFDYLVLATGSSYAAPIKEHIPIMNRASDLRKYFSNLRLAKTALVIGGGVTGVELAAEIVERFPDKKVTLVQADEDILMFASKKARNYAKKFLEYRNVKIMVNTKIIKHNGNIQFTNKGEKIVSDIVFICVGITPNFKLIKNSFKNKLDQKNFVKTNSFLQFANFKNIFVAGDVSNANNLKTAHNALFEAKIVIENIKLSERNKELLPYSPKPAPLLISLGKHKGILTYKKYAWCGRIPGFLKGVVEWLNMRKLR